LALGFENISAFVVMILAKLLITEVILSAVPKIP
jgi:hypothetical protein